VNAAAGSENRLTAAFLGVALVALFGGVVTGLFQSLEHAGVNVYPSTPLVKSYYHSLTLHGVLNVLVWTTFFICGFVPFIATRALRTPLASLGLAWGTFWLMATGLVMAAIPLLGNAATVMFTFYPPLKAHWAFYVGLTLVVVGTWLVNQWREIGLKVSQETQESSPYFKDLRAGNFEVSTDFQCGYVVDPDLDLYKFQSQHLSDANYGRYSDPVLDDLYRLQSRTVDPEQRRRIIRAFEKRLLDEEAHYIYTLQWHRIVPHSSRVRGWTITPSHYLNSQLDTVWLSE